MSVKSSVVDDELWTLIEPVLLPWPEHSLGPKPVLELGFGSGQTCWRRLERWQAAGVFDKLHRILLSELNAASELDWERLSRAREKGGAAMGPSPVDRRKTGSKHHLITDGGGIPLKVITTAANVNDVTQPLALVDGVPPVAGRVGHPRKRPDALLGDRGYDSNLNRKELLRRGILPIISRKGQPDIQSLSPRSARASTPARRSKGANGT